MAGRSVRKIVRIDEDKCNGCGACALKCAEGALKIIDGKARLVSETYCDGLGACLGECPEGAIIIEERPAENFDEVAVEGHLRSTGMPCREPIECECPSAWAQDYQRPREAAGGCPGSRLQQFDAATGTPGKASPQPSALRHWPVQLTLVPEKAPFLQGADVLLTAQCVPFACAGFHADLLPGHALMTACPKLDDAEAHLDKLTRILRESDIRSLTVVRMEVPCCGGLSYIAGKAVAGSGKDIPLKEIVVSVRGEILK